MTRSNSHDPEPTMWIVEHLTPYDAYHHGVREVLHSQHTAYQSMTIADTGPYGRALFLDGKIQTSEADEPFYHEPLVHTPCVAHGDPRSVLILGGADGGAAREALRWPRVSSLVVVDIDADVVAACRKFLPKISRGALDSPRARVIICDALHFIEETRDTYDVIVCDLTDPMENSPSLSLFTREFFQKLRAKLSERGALSIQAGPASLTESRTLLPRIAVTLMDVFGGVRPYQVFLPTFGSPLAMAVATRFPIELPGIAEVNAILSALDGDLYVLDGRAFHALFALPKCVTSAIAEEKGIYTTENTAKAYGRGILNRT